MEINQVKSPIEVIYAVHRALRAEADRAREALDQLDYGGSVQAVALALNSWVTPLMWHVEKGGQCIASVLARYGPAVTVPQDEASRLSNEQESSLQLSQRVATALEAVGAKRHKDLTQRVEHVLMTLHRETSEKMAVAHVLQHLFDPVLRLRMAQHYYLQQEAYSVIPLLAELTLEPEQLQLAGLLLADVDTEGQGWMFDWLSQHANFEEQALLARLKDLSNQVIDSRR